VRVDVLVKTLGMVASANGEHGNMALATGELMSADLLVHNLRKGYIPFRTAS
jgi:hypothetical protein